MFLYAVLLWPAIKRLAESMEQHGATSFEAMNEASHRVVAEQQIRTSLPKRFSIPMKEVLAMQRRFLTRQGIRAARLLEHKRFRAAYDFLLLRAECGEIDPEIADWWTQVQQQAPEDQKKTFGGGGKRRRGRRGRQSRPPASNAAS
jgi:poly(A) polymerase